MYIVRFRMGARWIQCRDENTCGRNNREPLRARDCTQMTGRETIENHNRYVTIYRVARQARGDERKSDHNDA